MSKISDFFHKHEDYEELKFVIEDSYVGMRIDTVIGEKTASITRSSLKTIDYYLEINGIGSKLSQKVKLGDIIEFYWCERFDPSFKPEKIDLNILYKDEDLMIIDKPWGLVVHPAKGHQSGTLANGILYYLQSNNIDQNFGDITRIGIVHRLDKDTRGLMLIALNEFSLRTLSESFKNRQITKIYKAIVKGQTPEYGSIEKPIGRSLNDRKKMAVVKTGGRNARTDFKALKHFTNHTLLACKLFTGRTHQIRVHLSHLGYPILNDELYSRQRAKLPGMALLASHLSFAHPRSGKEMSFTLSDPPEFIELTNNL